MKNPAAALLLWPARLIARAPLSISTKLLVAFLTIVGLLVVVGAVALEELAAVNRRAEEQVKLQRKIAAYRQIQQDTTAQLYGVASTLLVPEEQVLEATLRQLNQFGYDLDRLQFVAADEVELFGRVRKDYEAFIAVVTQVVELVRAGKVGEGREVLGRAGAAGRAAGAADQRAREQGRGRHGGAGRRGSRRLRRVAKAGDRLLARRYRTGARRWDTRSLAR